MTTEHRISPEMAALAEHVVQSRDRALRVADEQPDLPRFAALYDGQALAYDLVLSWIAGSVALGTREALEAMLARRARAAVAAAQPWTEAELRAAWGDR
jgi:hypothetical protein